MSRIKASIILPTFNESGNIIDLIEIIRSEFSKKRISAEIIIIDDNSPDKTGLLVQKYYTKVPEVRCIIRKKDKGLASAIYFGIKKAVGEIILVMDTDFNHDPRLLTKMFAKCQKYDFVIGSRYVKGGGMANKTRQQLSYLFNILIRIILSSPVKDNLSGFFAINSELLNKLNANRIFYGYGDYFIRLIYLAKLTGAKFAEVPSFYKERQYGESKSQFLYMFKDYLASTISLRFNS